MAALYDCLARLASVALQYGAPLETIGALDAQLSRKKLRSPDHVDIVVAFLIVGPEFSAAFQRYRCALGKPLGPRQHER